MSKPFKETIVFLDGKKRLLKHREVIPCTFYYLGVKVEIRTGDKFSVNPKKFLLNYKKEKTKELQNNTTDEITIEEEEKYKNTWIKVYYNGYSIPCKFRDSISYQNKVTFYFFHDETTIYNGQDMPEPRKEAVFKEIGDVHKQLEELKVSLEFKKTNKRKREEKSIFARIAHNNYSHDKKLNLENNQDGLYTAAKVKEVFYNTHENGVIYKDGMKIHMLERILGVDDENYLISIKRIDPKGPSTVNNIKFVPRMYIHSTT